MGSLPFLLSRPMTHWIEQRDEPADGTTDGVAVDGGDGAEQWRLWCSSGASRGEAQLREQRWLWRWRSCGVMAAVRPRAARWTKRRGRTMAWRRRGRTMAVRWKMNRKENLTVAALYRLEHWLIRCGRKRTLVQI
jgi:hypothetical protein